MAITQSPFNWYDKAPRNLKLNDLLSEDIRVVLIADTYTPNEASHEFYNVSITGELATANGYTSGGQSLATKTLVAGAAAGDWVFGSDNPSWVATGGNLVAKWYALYINYTTGNKPLIGYGALNYNAGTPLNVTVEDTLPLSLLVNTNGWFGTIKTDGV